MFHSRVYQWCFHLVFFHLSDVFCTYIIEECLLLTDQERCWISHYFFQNVNVADWIWGQCQVSIRQSRERPPIEYMLLDQMNPHNTYSHSNNTLRCLLFTSYHDYNCKILFSQLINDVLTCHIAIGFEWMECELFCRDSNLRNSSRTFNSPWTAWRPAVVSETLLLHTRRLADVAPPISADVLSERTDTSIWKRMSYPGASCRCTWYVLSLVTWQVVWYPLLTVRACLCDLVPFFICGILLLLCNVLHCFLFPRLLMPYHYSSSAALSLGFTAGVLYFLCSLWWWWQ